jgi:hypothetical protein
MLVAYLPVSDPRSDFGRVEKMRSDAMADNNMIE